MQNSLLELTLINVSRVHSPSQELDRQNEANNSFYDMLLGLEVVLFNAQ